MYSSSLTSYISFLKPDMIRRNGYICEDHVVTTSDGYILTIHRIPVGKQHGQGVTPCKFFKNISLNRKLV